MSKSNVLSLLKFCPSYFYFTVTSNHLNLLGIPKWHQFFTQDYSLCYCYHQMEQLCMLLVQISVVSSVSKPTIMTVGRKCGALCVLKNWIHYRALCLYQQTETTVRHYLVGILCMCASLPFAQVMSKLFLLLRFLQLGCGALSSSSCRLRRIVFVGAGIQQWTRFD